jgi:hypothetical protein
MSKRLSWPSADKSVRHGHCSFCDYFFAHAIS